MDELVEKVARAIVTAGGGNPDECTAGYSWAAGEMGRVKAGSLCNKRNWELKKEDAQAALAAIREAHAIVPREPTEAMLDAPLMNTSLDIGGLPVLAQDARVVWAAMISAAEKTTTKANPQPPLANRPGDEGDYLPR